MTLGCCWVKLFLHGNNSLKGKRKVVNSIKDKVRRKFNVSISEIDKHDNWREIVLGIATVSNNSKSVHTVLNHVIEFIDSMHLAEILDYKVEII